MKRSLAFWQFTGFIFTSIGGTLLHFLYEISGNNIIAAMISGVNESTFEHMKLLFFPMFFYSLIERKILSDRSDFWCVKLIGIITGLILIPTLFYTTNGVFGKIPDRLNIAIFYICAAVTFMSETRLFKSRNLECRFSRTAFIAICVIGIIFVIFTFMPPKIPLFKDPLSSTYGIP